MEKKREPLLYRPVAEAESEFWREVAGLDKIIDAGCYIVQLKHDTGNDELPLPDCNQEHYIVGTLIVTESGMYGPIQSNHMIGQILTLTSCSQEVTNVYSRTFVDDKWGDWRSLAFTGMYDRISSTDELVATIEELVAETQSIKAGLSSEIDRSEIANDSMKKNAVQSGSLQFTPDTDCIKVTYSDIDGSLISEVLVPSATTELAGVMSAEDKKRMNDLWSQSNILTFESGGISSSGVLESNPKRIRTATFLTTPFSYSLKDGYSVVQVLKYDPDENFIGYVATKENYVKDKFLYKISFKKNDGGDFEENENPISDYAGPIMSMVANLEEKTATAIQEVRDEIGFSLKLEVGSIDSSNGNYTTDSNRARTCGLLSSPLSIRTNEGYQIIHAIKFDKDEQFLGSVLLSAQEIDITESDECLYKFTFKRIDNGNITNFDDVVADSKTSLVKKAEDTFEQVGELQESVANNKSKIDGLMPLVQSLKKSTVDGVLPTSRNLEKLVTLPGGNVGCEAVSNFTATTYFRATNTWSATHSHILTAVVLKISNPSLLGFNTLTAVSLNCNYYTDNGYKNNICQEIVRLDENTYLLYDLSGKCVNSKGEEVLPATSYVRVSANTDVTIEIKKFYCAAVEYDGDITTYRECLISTALADYVWKDTLVSYKAVVDRNLSAGIAFWGSSSTEGNWVKNVAANLNMPYYWGGVGGENIWAIMGRMGVLPLRIETPITIPASVSEAVELPNNYNLKVKWKGVYKDAKIWVSSSVSPEKLLVNPCYIAGVRGNLIGSGASNGEESLKFQRLEDGVAVTTRVYEPIYTFGFRETRDCVWFLACHFNGGQSSAEELVELYKKMYDASESKKVLILGRHKVANGTVTSPTLAELKEQENALEDEFGLMFFNTREYMCGKGFERYKELYPANYTTADVSQAAQGITPDCMYESVANVHFNTRGYAVLTEGITNVLVQLGYNLFRAGGDISHPVY